MVCPRMSEKQEMPSLSDVNVFYHGYRRFVPSLQVAPTPTTCAAPLASSARFAHVRAPA